MASVPDPSRAVRDPIAAVAPPPSWPGSGVALNFAVFVTGAAVLVLEIAATRLLSPYYGSTLYTVSSVITVVLGALSLGYYVDRAFVCRGCGQAQVWRATQQKWWYEVAKGQVYSTAVRCRLCRAKDRQARGVLPPSAEGR
mgnify:CR=1 FL=1